MDPGFSGIHTIAVVFTLMVKLCSFGKGEGDGRARDGGGKKT